ncbi:uncharacterized protein ACIBXB_008099 [Morphnus guianensis]
MSRSCDELERLFAGASVGRTALPARPKSSRAQAGLSAASGSEQQGVSPSTSHEENPAWLIPLAAQSVDGMLSRGTIPIPFSGVFSLGLLSKKVCPSRTGLVIHQTEA